MNPKTIILSRKQTVMTSSTSSFSTRPKSSNKVSNNYHTVGRTPARHSTGTISRGSRPGRTLTPPSKGIDTQRPQTGLSLKQDDNKISKGAHISKDTGAIMRKEAAMSTATKKVLLEVPVLDITMTASHGPIQKWLVIKLIQRTVESNLSATEHLWSMKDTLEHQH